MKTVARSMVGIVVGTVMLSGCSSTPELDQGVVDDWSVILPGDKATLCNNYETDPEGMEERETSTVSGATTWETLEYLLQNDC